MGIDMMNEKVRELHRGKSPRPFLLPPEGPQTAFERLGW
jgi:hypothetical protein